MKINIVNSYEGVAWKRRLCWLVEERPSTLRALFSQKRLVEYLDLVVAHIGAYRAELTKQGDSREDAELKLALQVLERFGLPDETGERLTEQELQDISDYIADLEPGVTEVEV